MKIRQKNRGGNSSIIGTVVAAVCIVIYIAALVQAAVRLYLSIEQRRTTAELEFSQIADTALSAGTQGFMDERFVQIMFNALISSKSIEALIISGPEGEYPFEKQEGHAVTWVNNSPRFINRFSFQDTSLYRPLAIPNLRNVNIKAVAGTFDFIEITRILKETLLFIMIGFAVAFFTMLLQLLTGRGEKSGHSGYYASKGNAEGEAAESEQRGIYSPRTNIGWEEYAMDRLESELHRCSSTEKELTLILLEFTGLTDDAFGQAAEEAVSFFTSRDLLFEFGGHGIYVILQSVDLESGISKSEKYYQRVMGKLLRNFADARLCIGLSSRAGRLLKADRLMLETREALNKARIDPQSSIIAFKSDLEKYRTFVTASQSPKRP